MGMISETSISGDTDKGVVSIESESKDVLRLLKVAVVDQTTFTLATEAMKMAKALMGKMDETFDPVISSTHAAWKSALAAKKAHYEPLETRLKDLKKTSSAWYEKEQRRIADEHRSAKEKEATEAAKLAAVSATLGIDYEAPAPSPIAAAPKIQTNGVQMREYWSVTIVDRDAIPREYMIPDEKRLGELARSLKGTFNIPGVKAVCEKRAAL